MTIFQISGIEGSRVTKLKSRFPFVTSAIAPASIPCNYCWFSGDITDTRYYLQRKLREDNIAMNFCNTQGSLLMVSGTLEPLQARRQVGITIPIFHLGTLRLRELVRAPARLHSYRIWELGLQLR